MTYSPPSYFQIEYSNIGKTTTHSIKPLLHFYGNPGNNLNLAFFENLQEDRNDLASFDVKIKLVHRNKLVFCLDWRKCYKVDSDSLILNPIHFDPNTPAGVYIFNGIRKNIESENKEIYDLAWSLKLRIFNKQYGSRIYCESIRCQILNQTKDKINLTKN